MAEKFKGQTHIGHGKFVRYDKTGLQHIFRFCTVFIAGKSEGTVHGHRLHVPRTLRHPPACPSCRCCQKNICPSQLFIDIEHNFLYSGLSCSRSPGHNGYQMDKCLPYRILLSGGQRKGKFPLGFL